MLFLSFQVWKFHSIWHSL